MKPGYHSVPGSQYIIEINPTGRLILQLYKMGLIKRSTAMLYINISSPKRPTP